jgi:hypothetical protein
LKTSDLTFRILVGKPEGKRPFGIHRGVGGKVIANWIAVAGCWEYGGEISVFIKDEDNFSHRCHHCLRKDTSPWS